MITPNLKTGDELYHIVRKDEDGNMRCVLTFNNLPNAVLYVNTNFEFEYFIVKSVVEKIITP